jgi:hypothetical protein
MPSARSQMIGSSMSAVGKSMKTPSPKKNSASSRPSLRAQRLARYNSFTEKEREWIVDQHSRLPCHDDGRFIGTAPDTAISDLMHKGIAEGELCVNGRTTHKMYIAVKYIIRATLFTKYASFSSADFEQVLADLKQPNRKRLVGKQPTERRRYT